MAAHQTAGHRSELLGPGSKTASRHLPRALERGVVCNLSTQPTRLLRAVPAQVPACGRPIALRFLEPPNVALSDQAGGKTASLMASASGPPRPATSHFGPGHDVKPTISATPFPKLQRPASGAAFLGMALASFATIFRRSACLRDCPELVHQPFESTSRAHKRADMATP